MTDQESAVWTTRRQRFMKQAMEHVSKFADEYPDPKENKTVRDTYGGLCHSFPALVLQDGLCQAVAFIVEKETSANETRKPAFTALRVQVAATLGVDQTDSRQLLAHVYDAPIGAYLRETHLLLDAWIYYKRFAVSVLNVKAGETE